MSADARRAIGRRKFISECGAVTAALGSGALPLLLSACGGVRYAAASRIGGQLVLPVRELGSDGSALVEGGDDELPIYVRRDTEGNLSAISTRCMHKGCQVEPTRDRFVCPCHGSEYRLDGAVIKGPSELPLVRYRVTTDDASIYIHLDSVIRES